MFQRVKTVIGNRARGGRRGFIAVAALAAPALLLATTFVVDYVRLRQIEVHTQTALEAAARAAAIAYGNGVARSEAEARDVARQVFRFEAPSAATDDPEALFVIVTERSSLARYDGGLETPLRALSRLGAARVNLTATADAPLKGGVAGVAGPAPADRL